jgi:hypothetical protein
MRHPGFAATSMIRLGSILALVCWLGWAGFARADEASPFLEIDAGACAKLDDKNLQVGPPDADIVAACAALSRRAVLGQKFSSGPGALALLITGAVLIYVVLGVPIRSVAGLLARPTGLSTAVLSIEAALALFLRAAVGLAALAILSLPFAIAGGCVVMLVAAILSLRKIRAAPPEGETDLTPSALSLGLADAINDVYASATGILGLALLSRRDPRWVGAGIALALIASVPAIIATRRRLRREPTTRLATTAVLAALFGATAFSDPDLSPFLADAAIIPVASAALFALLVIGAGWRARASLRFPAAAD